MTVIISVWHKRPIYSPVVYTVYSPDTLTSTIEQEMSVYIVTDFFYPLWTFRSQYIKYMNCSISVQLCVTEECQTEALFAVVTWNVLTVRTLLLLSPPTGTWLNISSDMTTSLSAVTKLSHMTLYLQINTAKCGKPVIYHTDKYCAYVSIHIQIYFCKQTRGKNPQRNTSL